jgi:hypothetical protein
MRSKRNKASDVDMWKAALAEDEVILEDLAAVNKMVDDYNLLVPWMNAQMFHVNFDREVDKALDDEMEAREREKERKLKEGAAVNSLKTVEQNNSVMKSWVLSFFGKR